jgi:dsRNA-specific ribonuclease
MLGFIVTEFLFDWSPERSPGDMTEWRALIVSNAMLGMVTNYFSSHLRHSSQQLQRDIGRYLDLFSGLPSTDSSSSSHLFSSGLNRPKVSQISSKR